MRKRNRFASRTTLFALLLAGTILPAQGQIIFQNGPGRPGQETTPAANLSFKQDRDRNRQLRQAKDFLRGKQYKDALTLLQRLLGTEGAEDKEDTFFPEEVDGKTRYVSHKSEALRLIESLPEDGREVYELQFGVKARHLLDDGLKAGRFDKIETAARLYFHSEAGYEATYLLAVQELDRGNYLAAALHFDRLRKLKRTKSRQKFEPMLSLQTAVCWGRAGMPKLSVETLVDLKKQVGNDTMEIGGRSVRLFKEPDDALTWLADTLGQEQRFRGLGKEQWVMFRGDITRTAHSSPASPVWDAVWTVNTIRDSDADIDTRQKLNSVEEKIQQLSKRRRTDGLLMQPGLHPIIVGDLAVFRTLHSIWALNLRTGELEWKTVKRDESFLEVAGIVRPETPVTSTVNRNAIIRRSSYPNNSTLDPLEAFLDQRLWRDLNAGTLSSDGEFIYSVEDLDYYNPTIRPVFRNGQMVNHSMSDHNELVAYHAKTGKLKLRLGGPAGETGLPLAGHFFLGAPLPLGEQLFCLAEYRGETRLVVLETRKELSSRGDIQLQANVLWSQSLTSPDEGIRNAPLRRMAGLSPSYAGGVIVCPTAGGAVVAVDPSRRLMLWGYQYTSNVSGQSNPGNPFGGRVTGVPMSKNDGENRWLDAAVTVAESHIILTPRDSDEIHCVSLLDGTLLWKQPRGQSLYLAARQGDNLILAGKSELKAIRLSDGSPAWKQPARIPEPSGRGFQTGKFYHMPLETAEIATIDLTNGRVLAQTKTRSGLVPGNLVSANGLIVSQSIDRISGFKPFDVLEKQIAEKLKADPKDSEALALRGEIRLRFGEEQKGLSDLRDSVAGKPSDRARSLLASNLIEGLRTDFATYRKLQPEIEKLLTNADERSRYHRLLAAGLHEIGEHHSAFQEYLKLAGPNTGPWKDEQVGGDLTIRSDRWLQSRVDAIFEKSKAGERDKLTQEMQNQLALAIKSGGPEGVRRFVEAFGNLPMASKARTELARRLDKDANALEMEFLLDRLRRNSDATIAGQATLDLVKLFARHNHYAEAAELIADLETRFADVVLDGTKTGRQLAAELQKGNPNLSKTSGSGSAWPDRRLIASVERTGSSTYRRTYPIEIIGSRGPFFRNWAFDVDLSSRQFVGFDGNGKRRFSIPISSSGSNFLNQYGNSLSIHGHLIVAVFANRFMVVDGLAKEPRVLWTRDLYQKSNDPRMNGQVNVRQVIRGPGGKVRWIITDPYGQPLGDVGPVNEDLVVYQVGRTLFAAHPLTGDVLWKREGIQRGSRIFGDREYIFTAGPGANSATVYRASDGENLGSRDVAPTNARKASFGRYEVTWQASGDKNLLSYVDLLAKKIIWQKQFSTDAKVDVVDGDDVAVVEPKTGRFVLISLEDGKTKVDQPIEPDQGLNYFMVHRTKDRYVLMTYGPRANAAPNVVRVNALNYYGPLVHGYVYGFDRRSGKKIWTTFVRDQAFEDGQPGSLPILTFAARRYRYNQVGNIRRSEYWLAISVLDVRNGQLILDHEIQRISSNPYEMVVDPVRKKIDLKFTQVTVSISMTDQPMLPPDKKIIPRKEAEIDPNDNDGKPQQGGKGQPGNVLPAIQLRRGIQIQQQAVPIRRR